MKRLKQKIINKRKDDNAAATTIEFLFAILILVFFTIQIVDIGMYFSYRQSIVNSAQEGSRLVSVYGGSKATTISRKYGQVASCNYTICDSKDDVVAKSVADQISSSVGAKSLQTVTNAYQAVKINKISCSPDSTTTLGQRTSCTIDWTYTSMVKFGNKSQWALSWVPSTNHVTRTSPAEVQNIDN